MSKCSPQVVTCKAVVCWGMGGPVKVEEIQVEPPKSFEVRVKMLYASVCHTDVIGTKGYPFAILGAKMQGAAKIIGIDKNERKREKGNAFGMTDFINPDDFDKSISEVVQEFTGGRGVDHCIECTGVASLVNEAIEATKLGTGITIGVGSGNETSMKINCLPLLLGRTLKGSVLGGLKAKSDLPIIAEKCKNKEIQLGELLTHEVPLEDINKVFELLKEPDCVKIAIKI
ncbi:CYP enzymes assisting alcohol dehydrogenase-like [Fagus crenata]